MTREGWTVGSADLSALVAGDGTPIVLLHGIPTGAELWRDVLAPLAAAGHRALAPDLPGYGATRLGTDADHSLTGAADLLAHWLEELGPPAWLVGHDAGGAVAQLLAVRHPAVVSRLTLVNSIADTSWPAPRARVGVLAARAGLVRRAARLRLVPNPWVRHAVRRAFADPAVAAAVDQDRLVWDGKFSDPDGRVAFERHLAALSSRDTDLAARDLPAVRCPSQLVWGMEDPYQPWQVAGRRLHELLPGASVTQLDDCGHFPPLECPDRLVRSMLEWSAEVVA